LATPEPSIAEEKMFFSWNEIYFVRDIFNVVKGRKKYYAANRMNKRR